MGRSVGLAGALVAVATALVSAAPAQLPPPPGMIRAEERTIRCARTLAKFSVTISSHNGPLAIDAGDNKQYASISIDNPTTLVRTDGCRVLSRRPAALVGSLGRRWAVQQRFFEVKQFSCSYRGPLVVHARAVRSGGRYVNRISVWSNRGRLFAHGELVDGRGWLRVARGCSLTYSR